MEKMQPGYYKEPHFMIILSEACMAECKYCFGPNKGPIATIATARKCVDFIENIIQETGQQSISITFHGGEPLMAPYALWEHILIDLSIRFQDKKLKLMVQSNLWNLNVDFCKLFKHYGVALGTSLDGPLDINDRNRGKGYFLKTYSGIQLARTYDLDVGCIATFTPQNFQQWKDVMRFYIDEHLSFSIHPAVCSLKHNAYDRLFLKAEEYAILLDEMLEGYLGNRRHIQIKSFDQECKGVAHGTGYVCTYRNCFGMFLAIDPRGEIFFCQRFCGDKKFSLGNVKNMPSLRDIENHPNAVSIRNRENLVKIKCADCEHFEYCKGGCYYNALSCGDGIIDPYCNAYKQNFSKIKEKLIIEISSPQNVEAISFNLPANGEPPFLQKGKVISLTRNIHPTTIHQNAKLAIALHEIAKGPDLLASTQRMVQNGITTDEKKTYEALIHIRNTMLVHNGSSLLNNLYLHITFDCNLHCTHCYARAGDNEEQVYMQPDKLNTLLFNMPKHMFHQTVITGGEPLVHSQVSDILHILKRHKDNGLNLKLRTNLSLDFSVDFLVLLATSFNQIIVSLDGNEATHDQRRGKGNYQKVKTNLMQYQSIVNNNYTKYAELSLACVMSSKDIKSEPGQSLQALANDLGITRVRFRPLLPIGRARDWDMPPESEALHSHVDPMKVLEYGIKPRCSCGLGQNLYVEPSGQSFPCYAYHKPHSLLGNVFEDGLEKIISSEEFKKLVTYHVDNIEKCKNCEYRYLCGGACRAWGGEKTQYRLNAPPIECEGLQKRAQEILETAKNYIFNNEM